MMKKNLNIVLKFLFLNIIVAHLLDFLAKKTVNTIEYFNTRTSLAVIFISTIVIAPLVETFFVQYLIIEIIYRNFRGNNIKLYAILISSIIFGLYHCYNSFAIFSAFVMGLILSSNYVYFRLRTNPFFYTVLLHALYNLYAFIISDILKLA